jgi:hypothetical protein
VKSLQKASYVSGFSISKDLTKKLEVKKISYSKKKNGKRIRLVKLGLLRSLHKETHEVKTMRRISGLSVHYIEFIPQLLREI